MALSVIVYPGDGVRTQFNIPFALGYIKESDVTARVDGEVDGAGNQLYRTLVFLSPEIVEVQGTPVPVGRNIIFERTVVQDELIVDYEDGDVINEDNMNTSQKQMIMLVHQVLDGRFAQFQSGFDMGGFRISGLGDPVDPGDAANKRYVDGLISTGQASAASAAASAAAAANSASQAASSQASASSSASAASASQVAAANSQAAASASQTAAANSAASASANASATAADRVQTGQDRTATGMDRAATAADRVQTGQDRTSAAGSASSASTSANQALAQRNAAEAFKNYAYQWSSNPENNVVNDEVRTGYSAYHWAQKSAASAAAAQTWDPNNYVAKSGSTMTGTLTLPNLEVKSTTAGALSAITLMTQGSTELVQFGKRDTHAAYIQATGAKRWDFSAAGVVELPAGGRINQDGNLYIKGYSAWVDSIIARTSRMRMAAPAWADIRGTDGIRDSTIGGSTCLVGLTTNQVSGDNRAVVAMFYRQLQQTDISGNWYAIQSL